MRIYNLVKDFFVPKEVLYVHDDFSLKSVMKDLETKDYLAVDTEFIWRNTYFPKLSLIQISTEEKIYIFDCLTLNTSFFERIFNNKNILKIFHSIRGDSSVIFNCLGIKIENVFDTQLAEDILNQNSGVQISYKKLVKKYFYKNISKAETNSDWERRPLIKKQLKYAAEDVRYLHSIMDIQNKKIKRSNKIDLFFTLCDEENKLGQQDFSISRLKRLKKKNKNLSSKEIEIFIWRENQAKQHNIPPSYIFNDRYLKKLKKLIDENNFNECKWIIKKDSSRDEFISFFQ
ncbi:MAG: hypothetical protein CBB97_06695 [Candidatus Endolissoclinum sp. TMED37]|nr:MAG: hypothetical protein CBB97_06695 [Candidatus Endolissoclinum sp. TMED37]